MAEFINESFLGGEQPLLSDEERKKKDVYKLYDEIYPKVKEFYNQKSESFVISKVDDIITIIWRHYDYKPSNSQLRVEIQNQLSNYK
jgi:peroxiredoxin